jgi:hypothetical protein
MPRQRIHAADDDVEELGPSTERSPQSSVFAARGHIDVPPVYPGAARQRGRRARRCIVPKLLKLTVEESEALKALSADWGIPASDLLRRLLMKAHRERLARK